LRCSDTTGEAGSAGVDPPPAQTLLGDGHEVVVHARSPARLASVRELLDAGAAGVTGDLADLDQTRAVAGEWLASSADAEAATSGGYWHHQRRQDPHPAAGDKDFQDGLLDALAARTGVALT
jgi:NAD(P)-dependent dehydrogenase (short-subunit alcohol dehydrogenase family)